jgi:hypothetical protein
MPDNLRIKINNHEGEKEMAKTVKQLLADEKRKKVKIKKMESELSKEKLALAKILKEIPAAKKKAPAKKKSPARKKARKK